MTVSSQPWPAEEFLTLLVILGFVVLHFTKLMRVNPSH